MFNESNKNILYDNEIKELCNNIQNLFDLRDTITKIKNDVINKKIFKPNFIWR